MSSLAEAQAGISRNLGVMDIKMVKELQSILLVMALAEVYSDTTCKEPVKIQKFWEAYMRLVNYIGCSNPSNNMPPRLFAILRSHFFSPYYQDDILRKNLLIASFGIPIL